MVIFNCLSKGFVKIDGDFSVAAITKDVRFRQDGIECRLPEQEYIKFIQTAENVLCPCEYGDLIITTNSTRYVFENTMLSIDDSAFLVDEILLCLNSKTESENITIHLDCPNENSGVEFEMLGNLITEKLI